MLIPRDPQFPHDLRLPPRRDVYAGVLVPLHDAEHVFPVFGRARCRHDFAELVPSVWDIFIAVDVFEGEGDVAEGHFDGFGGEFCGVVLFEDELGLLFVEVEGQEDAGVCG
jgi:hypothetical protein